MRAPMTPDERDRVTVLCRRLAEEHDHQKFAELLKALNELLDGKEHRLENPGKLPLQLIEVQSGPYLGEDDIVRVSDSYGRA